MRSTSVRVTRGKQPSSRKENTAPHPIARKKTGAKAGGSISTTSVRQRNDAVNEVRDSREEMAKKALLALAVGKDSGGRVKEKNATGVNPGKRIDTESETDEEERNRSLSNNRGSGDDVEMRPLTGLNDPFDGTSGGTAAKEIDTNLLFASNADEDADSVVEECTDMEKKKVNLPTGNNDVQHTLAEKRRELEEKQSYKISAKLDDIEAMSLQGEWASKIFHVYKYVTEAMLDDEGEGSIMKEAFERMRLSTEDKKRQKRKAMKTLILSRVGNMRDYFVQRVKKTIIESTRK
jgi:hypothetical protein